jgi:hypothetical protein
MKPMIVRSPAQGLWVRAETAATRIAQSTKPTMPITENRHSLTISPGHRWLVVYGTFL